MSFCAIAIVPAMMAVIPPIQAINVSAVALGRISHETRHSMYTPAATIVAAWINAETGVGPSIASGNHTCSGNWALLPTAPQKISAPASASIPADKWSAGNFCCIS